MDGSLTASEEQIGQLADQVAQIDRQIVSERKPEIEHQQQQELLLHGAQLCLLPRGDDDAQ